MRTKRILIGALAIMALCVLLIALYISKLDSVPQEDSQKLKKLPFTFDFTTSGHPNPSAIGFDGSFPNMPSEMMVYKVVHPNDINESHVRKLAQKHFGMSEDAKLTLTPRVGLYWLKTSTHRVQVDPKTGYFSFRKIKKKDTQATTENDYPLKEDCTNIALKYLKNHNLYDKDAYFRGLVDNTKSVGAMSVGFGRKIAGYKTWGPGGEMSVQIGLGSEIVKVRKAWQELVPYMLYPIKTPKQALKDLHNRKGYIFGLKGKINKITLRYYTSANRQNYVQPIYYFECAGPDGDFYGVVPAIKAEYMQSYKEKIKEIDERRSRRTKQP